MTLNRAENNQIFLTYTYYCRHPSEHTLLYEDSFTIYRKTDGQRDDNKELSVGTRVDTRFNRCRVSLMRGRLSQGRIIKQEKRVMNLPSVWVPFCRKEIETEPFTFRVPANWIWKDWISRFETLTYRYNVNIPTKYFSVRMSSSGFSGPGSVSLELLNDILLDIF